MNPTKGAADPQSHATLLDRILDSPAASQPSMLERVLLYGTAVIGSGLSGLFLEKGLLGAGIGMLFGAVIAYGHYRTSRRQHSKASGR